MSNKRIKFVRGSHYTEAYSDAIQVVYSNGKDTAELLFCEDVPLMPEESFVTDENIESGNYNNLEYAGSRVIHARIKVPVAALNGIAQILTEASKALAQRKEK